MKKLIYINVIISIERDVIWKLKERQVSFENDKKYITKEFERVYKDCTLSPYESNVINKVRLKSESIFEKDKLAEFVLFSNRPIKEARRTMRLSLANHFSRHPSYYKNQYLELTHG